MKYLLLCLLFPVFISAQSDTIFKNDGKIKVCKITLTNESTIFFEDKKGYGDQILNSDVKYYSVKGVRHESIPYYNIKYSDYKIDTTRNELGHLKLFKVYQYSDTTLTKNVLFDRAKAFIYKTYQSGKDVILYDDKANGEIHCEAITKELVFNGDLIKNCNGGRFKYKVAIYTKDQKLKIVFEDIIHQVGSCPIESRNGSDFGDIYPSTWTKLNYNHNLIQYASFKKEMLNELNLILNYLEKITSAKNKDGDF